MFYHSYFLVILIWCTFKGTSPKTVTDVWIRLPISNWRYGDLAKLHAHLMMTSLATQCNYSIDFSPRPGCTYYVNLMTSAYQ